MAWIDAPRLRLTTQRRVVLFVRDTLPLFLALVLATLLVWALEARFGVLPAEFDMIGRM